LINWWFEIKDLLDIFYRFYERLRLGASFKSWLEYAALSKPEDRLEIRTFLSSILSNMSDLKSFHFVRKCYLKSRKSYFISIVPLLLFSIKEDGFLLPYMKKASILMRVPMNGTPKDIWLSLVRTFLYEWHPSGEVESAIRL
jgi:hypothetical protein